LKVLENRKYADIYDSDEVAWIFTGYYFNLYFIKFDLFHPDWNDYEAFDHPPLAKYVVGGSLYLKGYTIDSLDPKRFWNSIPINKFPMYFELVKHQIPNPTIVIPFTRSVIFVFALSSLLLIYVFVRISYGVLPAMVSTSIIMINPIFTNISMWILAEPILLFFFTLFILLCALYLKSRRNIYIVFAFIISSLAFLTKLNGILLVFVLIIIFLIKNKFSISKQDYKYLIAGFIAFLLITILLNPVFLNAGIKAIWKMVEVRWSAFHRYQETFKDVALHSLSERFFATTKMVFFKYSLFYQLIKVPVELIMFSAGIYYIFRRRDLLLILIFVFLVVIPVSILPYNTIKYYYWIFPFTHIIAGLSVNVLKDTLSKETVMFQKVKAN
jgi:4-amino-4-deoxy-L-arabinose transferase-like glycosyltransferase